MNEHIELGKINSLRIDRFTAPGAYLMAEDEMDLLLPNQYLTDDMYVDDVIDVFVYTDSEDRIVSTTQTPKAMLDQFGYFKVVDITKFGAFVDWGLPKDLFVPRNKQKNPFNVGESHILRVEYDEQSHRLMGVERIQKYLKTPTKDLVTNLEVDILVFASTPMGFKVIINHDYEGMIYKNEIFDNVKVGYQAKAYIKAVRSDNKIDVSLQKIGNKTLDQETQTVMDLLHSSGESLPYNYKSDAELIKKIFKMSKKSFKKSLTTLVENKEIEVKDTGIYTVKNNG